MIEKILIIEFIVWGIYITMQEDMIFEKLGVWLENKIASDYWSKPVHACVICMSFWHGLYIYWIVFGNSWYECLVCCVGAMGANAIVSRLLGAISEASELIFSTRKTKTK